MEKGQSIRTISRALHILKAINRLDAPTLTEIARTTSLPYATTFRLVHALIEEGMVEQEPFRKRYKPTQQVRMLSAGFQEDNRLINAAMKPMKQFTQNYFWPVALTVRVGNRMMVQHSTSQLTTQTLQNYYPGETYPLLHSSSGRAYLAFCDGDELKAIIEGLKVSGQKAPDPFLDAVQQGPLLGEIRASGYASYARTTLNKNPGKTSAFSVPIRVDGSLRGCLTMVFFVEAHSMREALSQYLEPTQALAAQIAAGIHSVKS